MKKKAEKKLSLSKIKIASLSKPDQQAIQGGIPPPTAPIVCKPTVFKCPSVYYVCTYQLTTVVANYDFRKQV